MKNSLMFGLLASVVLAGCSRNAVAAADADKHLTVTGSQDGVIRFAKLQGSLRSALAVSPIKRIGGGQAEVVVTLPTDFSTGDLVHTTREALAAGLSYKFEEDRYALTTVRS